MSEREVQLATTITSEDSNSVIHNLVYRYSATVGTGAGCQDFDLQITDPDDPLLLFDYKLAPSEFSSCKEAQQLICEFSSFPDFLTEKLTDCLEHHQHQALIDQRSESGPYLILQEKGRFRLLTHLQLPLVPASDARLKTYISREAKRFKAELIASQEEVAQLRAELESKTDHARKHQRRMDQKFGQQKQDFEEKIRAVQDRCEAMLEEQRQALGVNQLEQAAIFEKKELSLVTKFERQNAELQNRVAELASERSSLMVGNERLNERIRSLEGQNAEMKARLEALQIENRTTQLANATLQAQNAGLESELTAMTAKSEARGAALEQKSELASATGNQVYELKAIIAQKDGEITHLQTQVAELAEKAKDRDWIAEKSKKVIAKHQADIRKLVQHHNDRKASWEAQMERMREVQVVNARLEETVKAHLLAVDRANGQIDQLQETNIGLQNTIAHLEKEDVQSKQSIAYLENQLNRREQEFFEQAGGDDALDSALGSPVHLELPEIPGSGGIYETPAFY
jgi:chromosome segregation ATPase